MNLQFKTKKQNEDAFLLRMYNSRNTTFELLLETSSEPETYNELDGSYYMIFSGQIERFKEYANFRSLLKLLNVNCKNKDVIINFTHWEYTFFEVLIHPERINLLQKSTEFVNKINVGIKSKENIYDVNMLHIVIMEHINEILIAFDNDDYWRYVYWFSDYEVVEKMNRNEFGEYLYNWFSGF